MSEEELHGHAGTPLAEEDITVRRPRFLGRLIQRNDPETVSIIAMEHRAAPATSWMSKVREDLKWIKETLGDDEKLPDPEVPRQWGDIIRDKTRWAKIIAEAGQTKKDTRK